MYPLSLAAPHQTLNPLLIGFKGWYCLVDEQPLNFTIASSTVSFLQGYIVANVFHILKSLSYSGISCAGASLLSLKWSRPHSCSNWFHDIPFTIPGWLKIESDLQWSAKLGKTTKPVTVIILKMPCEGFVGALRLLYSTLLVLCTTRGTSCAIIIIHIQIHYTPPSWPWVN